MRSPEYQCDMKMCTKEGVVYGQCIEHAPESWLREVLDEEPPILDEEQSEKARERLQEEYDELE